MLGAVSSFAHAFLIDGVQDVRHPYGLGVPLHMKQVGRISIGAIIVATLLGVLFYESTGISITAGLASLFALVGLLVSWATLGLAQTILKRRNDPSRKKSRSTQTGGHRRGKAKPRSRGTF
jgi:hypothetical protein